MRKRTLCLAAFAWAFSLASCTGTGLVTGLARVDIPLFVAGTKTPALTTQGGVPIVLQRAQLAFGPLYLCPGAQAGKLCHTARLEWLHSVVVDAMDERPVSAGTLVGTSGPVKSWMFDLGLTSQLTQRVPVALEAAAKLGGVSLILQGEATLADGTVLPFRAAVPVQQSQETELGVPVVRKSTSDVFSHDVLGDEGGLLIRFDSRLWLQGVDFRDFLEDASCTPGGAPLVCAGAMAQRCAFDGSVLSKEDCAEKGQLCLANTGCAKELVIAPKTQAFRSIHNALVAGHRPNFQWLETAP